MRSRSDPLLSPGASKDTALTLIRSGIEMKNGAPSAARIAKECLARGYLLSHEERLLVGYAILVGTSNASDTDQGEAAWRLAAVPLLRRGRADIVAEFALRLFTTHLERNKLPKARAALEKAKPAVELLPERHHAVLQYARGLEEYVYQSGDVDGGVHLTLK
jgi:hypothetical protein